MNDVNKQCEAEIAIKALIETLGYAPIIRVIETLDNLDYIDHDDTDLEIYPVIYDETLDLTVLLADPLFSYYSSYIRSMILKVCEKYSKDGEYECTTSRKYSFSDTPDWWKAAIVKDKPCDFTLNVTVCY